MPYKLVQSGDNDYYVVNSDTGRPHSRRPLPRKRAVAQMRALYAAENKDAGTTAGPMLSGPGGLLGVPGMGRKWGNRQKRKDCTCGIATKEQIAPGITRIRGNLCNVHGRYGPCDPSKPSTSKKLTGRARKPRKVAAPKKTPEQRAQEREAQQSGNRAKVFSQLGLQEDAVGALQDLRSGIPIDDDGGLVKMGLAERAADGSFRLTASGRAVVSAANSGDPGRARDILSSAGDRKIARDERTAAADTRRAAAEQRRQEVQARRAAREAERQKRAAERAKKQAQGRKKPKRPETRQEPERRTKPRVAPRADTPAPKREAQPAPRRAETARAPESKPKKITPKRQSNKRPEIQRPAKKRGRFDRSNNATRSKSFTVYKSANGDLRWIARTTTAYKDRDDEIITTAALDRDSQRMTATQQFGPLRFWHLGRPDPLNPSEPWGEGVDIGDCDYSTQIGTSRVESGTFRDPIIAQRVANTADDYELSPGFFHPIDQPNARREYEDIRTFERSLVPTKYGRASNLFTGITVKEFRMDVEEQERRFKAAIEQLQLTPEQATKLASGLVQADKSAQAQGVAFKSADAAQEVTINGLVYTLKAPAVEVEIEDDGADEEAMDDGPGYLGDMEPGAFWTAMKEMLTPALKMDGMLKAMEGHLGELKSLYSGATTKSATDTAEIAALKSQIAEAGARLARLEGDQPAIVNSADVEAALKGAPQAPPDPNAPVVPDDPNRPYAAIGARTFPSLYSTNPDGTFAGWNPPAQIN